MKMETNNMKPWPPVKPDLYPAVIVGFIDTGHHDKTWDGKTKKRWEVKLVWEVPSAKFESGDEFEERDNARPILVSEVYTWNFGDQANLPKVLHSLLGRPLTADEKSSFDTDILLGLQCRVGLVNSPTAKGGNWTTVDSLMVMSEDQEVIAPSFEPFEYGIKEHGLNFPENMSKWDTERVKKSYEWAEMADEIPF